MLDARMRKLIDPPLDRIGAGLARLGVTADAVTLAGLVPGALAVWAVAEERYWLALALILLNRLGDGLDGAVARHSRPTDFGGYLDIVGDFVFYAAVPFGFVLADPVSNGAAGAFLLVSFVGTGSSFLAFAIIAAKREVTTDLRGHKSFYYLGGLAEGTETIAVSVAFCVWPQHFVWIAYGYGAVCWVTAITRILAARTMFRDEG